MSHITITLALTALAGVGWAGEGARSALPAEQEPSAQVQERLDAIEAEASAIEAQWREEQKRLREEHTAALERAKEKGDDPPPRPAFSMRPDYSELVERLVGWADQSQGEDAARYLARAVLLEGVARDSRGRVAFERLVAQHPDSPSWATLGHLFPHLGRAVGEEQRQEVLKALGRNPDPDVRGWLALARHAETIEKAALESEEYRTAKAALEAALAATSDSRLQRELQAPIELRERLSEGAVSPDIEGIDLDGESFKLSDYRGKVILLSFWGDW